MIIGGVNGAGKIRGMRTNACERYLPCRVYVFPTAVEDTIDRTTQRPLTYTASARIRNVADNAWVSIGAATYFQVTRSSSGSLDTADLTVQQPDTWSPFISGGTYEDVLMPSNRRLQIWAGLVIAGTSYTVPVFEGHVTQITENRGGSGGAITLRLEDLRDLYQRTASVPPSPATFTAYRAAAAFNNQVNAADATRYGISTRFSAPDKVINSAVSVSVVGGGAISLVMERMLSGIPGISIRPSGELDIGQDDPGQFGIANTFNYTDDSLLTLNRVRGLATFNTSRIYYEVAGVGTTGEVSDAADVAKRGKIYYAAGFIGGPDQTLASATATANTAIGQQLNGTLSLSVPFNPFLTTGQWISVQSTRASYPLSEGPITDMNHQYSVGRAITYVTNWRGG